MISLLRVVAALILMARPSHLALITLVYFLGLAVAAAHGAVVDLSAVALGLLALMPMSMSVHYANEYADSETDARTQRTPFSGGSGALARYGLGRRLALVAAWLSLAVALGIAAYGMAVQALPLLAFLLLVLGGGLGWMYSLPPMALAWRGWGELDNALAGGMVLPLYGYATLAGGMTLEAIIAFVPFTALVFNNLLATTWPDRTADESVGKLTLATSWPASKLRQLYWLIAGVAILSVLLLQAWNLPWVVSAASLAAVPWIFWGGWRYTRSISPLPTVGAMVMLALLQFSAWLSQLG